MDGSEARKTKDEKEPIYCKVVIHGQPVELFLKYQKMATFGGLEIKPLMVPFYKTMMYQKRETTICWLLFVLMVQESTWAEYLGTVL